MAFADDQVEDDHDHEADDRPEERRDDEEDEPERRIHATALGVRYIQSAPTKRAMTPTVTTTTSV